MLTSSHGADERVLDRRRIIAWRNSICVVFGLAGLGFSSWASRLPAIRDALDLRVDQVGLLVLAVAVGSILGLTLAGHLVGRIGARAAIRWGFAVTAVGVALTGTGAGVVASFALTFAGLLVYGFMTGVIDVAMNVSGAANERAVGKTVMPVFHAFFSFGTMLGAGLGALAELAGVGVAVHLAIIAGAILVISLIATRFVSAQDGAESAEATGESRGPQTWRGRMRFWLDPRTLLLGVLVLSAGFAEGSANDWIAIAMVDGHSATREGGALTLGVFLTAMTVGRLGGAKLVDRFGRVATLRVSFLVAALGVGLFIVAPDDWLAGVGAALWGLGAALGFPVGMSAAADDPRSAAARVGVVATIGYLAFLAGPPLIGFIGQQVGVLGGLIVVGVLAVVGAVVSGSAREPAASSSPSGDETP